MNFSNWTTTLEQLSQRLVDLLPALLGALALLLLGWLLAAGLRLFSRTFLRAMLSRVERRSRLGEALAGTRLAETAPRIIATFVYWSVFLFFAAAAMEQLPIPIVTDSLHSIAFYIPKVLLGVLVVFIGVGAGSLANQWITGAAGSAGMTNSAGLGRVAQVSILIATLIVGLEQVGLESNLFTAIVAIVIAAILGGMALAFGLGSGPMVSNIMGSYHAAKAYRIGDFIRIAGYEGTVREINPASIVLDSPDGEVYVPAKEFGDHVSIVQRGKE